MDAAERTPEVGCEAFLAELVQRLPADRALDLLDRLGVDETQISSAQVLEALSMLGKEHREALLASLNDEVAGRNFSDDHVLGLLSDATPEHWAERFKADYLPALRIVLLTVNEANPRDVLYSTEGQLLTFSRHVVTAIEARRGASRLQRPLIRMHRAR